MLGSPALTLQYKGRLIGLPGKNPVGGKLIGIKGERRPAFGVPTLKEYYFRDCRQSDVKGTRYGGVTVKHL
jgi:hypothetical protein